MLYLLILFNGGKKRGSFTISWAAVNNAVCILNEFEREKAIFGNTRNPEVSGNTGLDIRFFQ